MRKILQIIKREYLTRVRTKGFIIGTVIVPLLGVGSILLVVFLVGHTATQTSRIVIVDNSGQLGPAVAHGLDGKLADGQPQFAVEETVLRPASPDALQQDLRARINSETLDAYLGFRKTSINHSSCTCAILTISASSAGYRAPWIRR